MFPRRISRTAGNSRSTMSGVESGLPLSTTVTRISPQAGCSSSERRQCRSSPSAPWLTMTTSRSTTAPLFFSPVICG